MDYAHYKALKVEKNDKLALVTLNRPDSLNAFDDVLHHEMEDVLEDLGRDPEVAVAVLTGAGKAFSSGGNIKAMQARLKNPSLRAEGMSGAYRLINNFVNLEKPIIAAVNGDAIGLGASVALCCDVIFVSENARIGDPHVKVRLVAGDGGCVIWPLLLGIARAKEYLMSGDLIPAREAERMGLVNHVVPQDKALDEAQAFARRLAGGAIQAISWTKMAVNEVLRHRINLVLHTSLATEWLSFKTADHAEAVNAFVERRPPKFTGQ